MLESMTIEQLNRVLTISKWTLGGFAVITACLGIFNEWLSYKINKLNAAETANLQRQLDETSGELARLTTSRKISLEEESELMHLLGRGPKGRVLLTYLSTERDAQKYAEQISTLLNASGFDSEVLNKIWLQFSYDGLYICAHQAQGAPPHAVHVQQCFSQVGIRMKGVEDKGFCEDCGAGAGDAVVVVSNR